MGVSTLKLFDPAREMCIRDRVVIVGGGATLAGDGLQTMCQRTLGDGALLEPLAVQMHHVVIHGGKLQAGAEYAFDVHGVFRIIFYDDAAGHDRQRCINGVQQLDHCAGHTVTGGYFQRFAVAGFTAQGGQAAERGFLRKDTMGDIADIGGDIAVCVADLQRGDAEITGAVAGVFAGRDVRGEAGAHIMRVVRREGGEGAAVQQEQQIVVRQISAVVQMQQVAGIVDRK